MRSFVRGKAGGYTAVHKFWFEEIDPKQWWARDDDLDELIRQRFSDLHQKAVRCELYPWRKTPRGRLAEIIALDQFSRNIFRNRPEAFANDALALALAQVAVDFGMDKELNASEKSFLYMPFMHSESLDMHDIAMALYAQEGLEYNYDFEKKHKAVIERFGRYPHRNAILGRESTPEEIEYLQQPGSGF